MVSALSDTPSEQEGWLAEINQCLSEPDALKSNLTAIGDPVEFQVSWNLASGAESIRATLDPNATSLPSTRRYICSALVDGLTDRQTAIAQDYPGPNAVSPLHFGGWVGIRKNSSGFYRKLYLESPPVLNRCEHPEAKIFSVLTKNLRAAKCLMFGLDPSDGSVEGYFSAAPLSVTIFKEFLRHTDLFQYASQALALISELSGQHLRTVLPTDQNGISISLDMDRQVDAVTWYTHADHLLGPPQKARHTLLEFGRRHGLDLKRYSAMSQLGPEIRWHGVLGLTLKRGYGLALSITCATHTLSILQ